MRREIKYCIKNRYCILSFFLLSICCIQLVYPYPVVINSGGLWYALEHIVKDNDGFVRQVLLIFGSALPVVRITEELSANCHRNYVLRMGSRRYIASRMVGVVAASFISVVLMELVYLLMYLYAKPHHLYVVASNEICSDIPEGTPVWLQMVSLSLRIIRIGMYTAMWAAVTLAIAAWTDNRYIVLGAAYGLEKLLNMLTFWGLFYWRINPAYVFEGDHVRYTTPYSVESATAILYNIIVIAIAWMLFSAGMKRRIASG